MKTIVWIIIAVIAIGAVALFISSNNTQESDNPQTDNLSDTGRVTDTDENILAEIDEAINLLE